MIAPLAGTFRCEPLSAGEELSVGAALGLIDTHRVNQRVATPHGGTLVEWLAEDGDPVSPGQPLARLHPEAAH